MAAGRADVGVLGLVGWLSADAFTDELAVLDLHRVPSSVGPVARPSMAVP
jgi:hypothetical protein